MIDIETILIELDQAALSEGTELGEYWRGLCNFWDVVKYSHNPEFIHTIENEIRSQYEWMKDNFTWVERPSIKCDKCGLGSLAYKELVWNEELDG